MQNENTLEQVTIYDNDKVIALIDGANIWSSCKNLSFDIDYKRLLALLKENFKLVRAVYYTATVTDSDNFTKIKPILDWLSYNGYFVVEKPAKVIKNKEGAVVKTKGNMDIEIAVHAMEATAFIDVIMLFSGDGDFTELVRALQRQGKRVIVISTMQTSPSMIADELRRQADYFVDIATMKDEIERIIDTEIEKESDYETE